MKKLFLVALILCLSFLFYGQKPTYAQSIEKINSFDTKIYLDTNSTAEITETIEYDFGSNSKHGIYRDIPIQYFTTDDKGYELSLNLSYVLRDGKPEKYSETNVDGKAQRLQIGDGGKTISGIHTYTIAYTLAPTAIKDINGNAIVRFNTPGPDWQVPVESASITVEGPKTNRVTCYQGTVGTNLETCNASKKTGTFSTTRTLAPRETITAELEYPLQTFSTFAEEKVLTSTSLAEILIPIFIFIATPIIALGILIRKAIILMRYKQRRNKELVIPQYEPPKNMGPAEVGLLLDNSSSGAELTACIVHLAVQGYIKITEIEPKKWYKKSVLELEKLKEPDTKVLPYEKKLFTGLFGTSQKVTTKELSKSTSFTKVNQTFHTELKTKLETLGFYKKLNFLKSNLAAKMSDSGYKKWAEIEGFREFLSVTEKDRMKFHDAPEKKPEQFSQYLPYAIAMGVEKAWAKQFEDIGTNMDSWYTGSGSTHNLASIYALSSLSSSLNSIGTASTSSSSGSSGFGGGFSGGGFSGGGGGSW